jgi:hypothetical protein
MKIDSVSRQLGSLSDYMPGGPSSSSLETYLPSSKKNGDGGGRCDGMDDKMM